MYYCRVCGLYSEELPWGEDGKTPSYDFCYCCGVEFGYEDYIVETVKCYRNEWIENGAKWSEEEFKPENWDLEEQMKNIPERFR